MVQSGKITNKTVIVAAMSIQYKHISLEDKSKPSKSIKDDPHTNHQNEQEIEYFIEGQGTEVDRVMSADTTLQKPDEFSDVVTGTGFFKSLSPNRSKMT